MASSISFLIGRRLGRLTNSISDDGTLVDGSTFSNSIAAGTDSASVIDLIVANRRDSNFVTDIVDSAYVRLMLEDPAPTWTFQGQTYSYTSGGGSYSGGFNAPFSNVISKFSYASETDDTNVSTLTVSRTLTAGLSSETNSYAAGGYNPSTNVTIDKFPFATDANATDVGDAVSNTGVTGMGDINNGFTAGGGNGAINNIQKYSYSSDGNSTDWGDLTQSVRLSTGQSSATYGYRSGGRLPGGQINVIDKFSFTASGNATDVGDLSVSRESLGGTSSTTYGYSAGGFYAPQGRVNVIDKFPFAADENAADVGDLSAAGGDFASTSSTANGYLASSVNPSYSNRIEKHSFQSDGNSSDVGNLATVRSGGSGTQT